MTRNVLMLAFHFPPFAQSSGSLRTLSFVRHLPEHNWQPVVLTARPHVYPEVDARSLEKVPPRARVVRAVGLDIARHVAIAGRYPTWLATPDRWNTWAAAAVVAGLVSIQRHRPAVLWATFPIASALVAAILLHRLTRIPLIVDLRDPMVFEGWPEERWMRATYGRIEKHAVSTASATVVTTPSTHHLYVERYSDLPAARFRLIANGGDIAVCSDTPINPRGHSKPIILVHSGLMEKPERDPTAFFEAIAQMRARGDVADDTLRVILRATGRDEEYRRQIASLGIDRIVHVEGRISHSEATAEMRRADGLLLFQGALCNRQIPAKTYEYLASRRPIIGFLDAAGDTHNLVADQWKAPYVADMNTVPAIIDVLRTFIHDFRSHKVFIPAESLIEQHSRALGARELAALFNEVAA